MPKIDLNPLQRGGKAEATDIPDLATKVGLLIVSGIVFLWSMSYAQDGANYLKNRTDAALNNQTGADVEVF